jgi:hypothetical protein
MVLRFIAEIFYLFPILHLPNKKIAVPLHHEKRKEMPYLIRNNPMVRSSRG